MGDTLDKWAEIRGQVGSSGISRRRGGRGRKMAISGPRRCGAAMMSIQFILSRLLQRYRAHCRYIPDRQFDKGIASTKRLTSVIVVPQPVRGSSQQAVTQ